MKVEFITKEDLEIFKQEIITEIRRYSPFNRKKDQEIKQWIKSYEVRKLLGISPGTLQNMRINGTIPFKKIGGLMFYRYEDILKMMVENPVKLTT
ncbi:helix-turn-helix domain-containing protein [Myroides odoratimimus]|uniref:helix-turn-helix domain-containing protein n=1 Tax=Myroides odoratimimus TaxID=76832 RepID=UPI002576364D|nr:helix-turn-helix domain-containing protein [Myroides odoratimimus]MDM1398497.1 helix-turn-helix domain-containing protein [Myroides odoratimimus]